MHLPKCGHACDDYLCQVCGTIHCEICDGNRPVWTQIPDKKFEGNICPDCQNKMRTPEPMSLYEYCRRESGHSNPSQIRNCMNRHYGVG
jgi:hypothetical protein